MSWRPQVEVMAPRSWPGLEMEDAVLGRRGEGPNMVTTTRVVVLIVASLSLIVCISRLYVRRFVRKAFGFDDYLVILALISVLGFATLSIVISFYGLGRRQAGVSPEDLLIFLKIYYIALCTYLFVACAVKASLTIFIMRIFPNPYILKVGYGMIAFLVVFCLSGEITLILQCRPVKAGFDHSIPGKCYSTDIMYGITLYQGVLMFLADVIIIILPMPALWALQLPLKRRIVLMGLFSFGLVACIASLVRFSTLAYTKDEKDYTYSAAASLIWMNLEYNLGLVAGSLSSLRPLFNIQSFWSTHNDSTNRTPGRSSQHGTSKKGYELQSGDNWRGKGIMKTSEITTVVEDHQDGMSKTSSQERIVPKWGQERTVP